MSSKDKPTILEHDHEEPQPVYKLSWQRLELEKLNPGENTIGFDQGSGSIKAEDKESMLEAFSKLIDEMDTQLGDPVNLRGKFGMVEMEKAALRILAKHYPLALGQCVTIGNMRNDAERTGFVELLTSGWLGSDPLPGEARYNGEFFLTKGFVERCQ